MKKILVPTDFSEPANWAMDVAIEMASRAKAEITLLHVIEQGSKESFNVEGQIDYDSHWEDKIFTLKLIERSNAQLAASAALIADAGVSVKKVVRLGNPFHGINATIRSLTPDLVIMGTSSHSKTEEIFIGSNAQKIVRLSQCPVLTVHRKPRVGEFKSIVYATSLSESEKAFSSVISTIQALNNAQLHIVRINTPLNFRPDTEVKRMMENFARQARLKNFTLNIFNDMTEEAGILHFASAIEADLIGMATHGRSGFGQLIAGSIAEDVVNHATHPVLTYVTE